MVSHARVDRYPVDFANPATQMLMLQNRAKYELFSEAIAKSVYGRTVLDIGTGSGILAMLCLLHGARMVVAVDRSPVDSIAHAVCDYYCLGDKIDIRTGDFFDLDFKGDIFDVIISETIGYLGFEENIHQLLSCARQRVGRDTTILIPSHLTVMLEPVSSFNSVGFSNPYLTTHRQDKICAKRSMESPSVDLGESMASRIRVTDKWEIEARSAISAIAVYFNARLADSIHLCNKTSTQWPHCVIPLTNPVTVAASGGLVFSLEMSPNSKHAFDVLLQVMDDGGHKFDRVEFASTDIRNDNVLPLATSTAEVIGSADSLIRSFDRTQRLPAIV